MDFYKLENLTLEMENLIKTKLHNIPIDKVFSKALQSKFHWAFDVDETYIF